MTKTDQESIDIHIRTYRSALRSSNEISLETLTPTYLKVNPLIHLKASSENEIDLEALFYAFNRFPKEILLTKKIIIGQTKSLFEDHGFDLSTWEKVSASRRRRRYFFDNKTKTLACFSASISDVDDIVNLALAFQVEFNKIFIMN